MGAASGQVVSSQPIRLTSLSRGAGCACKLPINKLESLFTGLGAGLPAASGDLLIGALEGDDAAVLRLDAERALVLTADFFTPIVDDPFDWGRIAAANALSDVYAMGGRPLIAVNLAAWPGEDLPIEMLADVIRGGATVATAAGCPVVGGHTIDDPIPKFGMSVVGLAHPDRLFSIDRLAPGDELVLTKPLGTGVIATALKQGAADPAAVAASVASMSTLNDRASEAGLAAGVRAATDITGFGLLGHLHRMLRASGMQAHLDANVVPLLPGAVELTAAGYVSGGTRANIDHIAEVVHVDPEIPAEIAILLHDAQTSGGLLLATPDGARLVNDLTERGVSAAVIGTVSDGQHGHITVRSTEQ
jgi:selenide,water dikinase